jgi:hypothetical protein
MQTRKKPPKIYLKKMDTHKLPNASEVNEVDLTDASYWKPIYEEIKRIQEQREVLKASVVAGGY